MSKTVLKIWLLEVCRNNWQCNNLYYNRIRFHNLETWDHCWLQISNPHTKLFLPKYGASIDILIKEYFIIFVTTVTAFFTAATVRSELKNILKQ